MVAAPSGTVTFLFTDIQGSTRLWQDDPSAMEIALKRHDEILRKTVNQNNGHVFKTVGDAFCCAFAEALDAVRATVAVQLIIREEVWKTPRPIRVRMSLHTGAARERDNDYFGPPVNRVARIESLAHGGQVIMSRSTAELVRDSLPEGIWLEDKGSHRLKDLARPEEIFQVNHPDIPSEFPPLKSMDVLPNNLPAQTTPLIGREKELETVSKLFEKDGCRLVTLVGPGGMGKTRLSLQVAADMVDKNRDGTWFVDLSTITQPAGVALETGKVLSIPQKPDVDPVDQVAEVLSDKNILIVLDNFEQVMSAYKVVVIWMQRSPGVRFLVTSREPLNIRGEQVFYVPPLSLPIIGGSGILSQFEGTRLFIDRACASKPDFEVNNENAPFVAEICSRLDGIPLAIELAAARIKLISPKAILKRLDSRLKLLTGGHNDMPDRHKTLRACIDWSYDLLNDEERVIYRHLSVFSGGISLAGATAVLESLIDDELEVLEGLESLVDKSLVYRKAAINDEPFFGILETIGEYGRERLVESEEDNDSLNRHAGYFLSLVMNARDAWDGPEQKAFIDNITANQENIRHAMDRFVEMGEGTAVISMTRSLVPFWIMRSEFSVGREWLWAALALCVDPECQESAWLMMQMGWLSLASGNYDEGEYSLKKALGSFRSYSDFDGVAECLSQLAFIENQRGNLANSEELCREARESAIHVHNFKMEASIDHMLGSAYMRSGRFEDAEIFFNRALTAYVDEGNRRSTAEVKNDLGCIQHLVGNFPEAKKFYLEALPDLVAMDHYQYLRYTWSNLGELALVDGDFKEALVLYEKVKNLSVSRMDHRYSSCAFVGIADSYLGLGDSELAEMCALEALELAQGFEDSVELGTAYRVIGDIKRDSGDYSGALDSYISAEEILKPIKEDDELRKIAVARQKISAIGGEL